MVILRESADPVLKLLSVIFITGLSWVASYYSMWEMYIQKPEIFSVLDLVVCGALIVLSVVCVLLRNWLNFDINEEESF